MLVWHDSSPGFTRTTDAGVEIANDITNTIYDSVWIEGKIANNTVRAPIQRPVAYELQKRGIALQAVSYGKIAQSYSTHSPNGDLIFDTLLMGKRLPSDGTVELSGGWATPCRGTIDTGQFTLVKTVDTKNGPLFMYRVSGGC